MAKRHIFAIGDLDASKKFVERCKQKGWIASVVISIFFRLFNSGKMDVVISSYEDDAKNKSK